MGLHHYHNAGALIQAVDVGIIPQNLSTSISTGSQQSDRLIDRHSYRQHFESCTVGVVVSATSIAAANHVFAQVILYESPVSTSIGSELTDVLPEGAATSIVANGDETKVLQLSLIHI